MIKYELLPFSFRQIESIDKVLITNINGGFCFVDNYAQLTNIINKNFDELDVKLIDKLLSTNVISESDELDAKINIITSNYASQIHSTIYSDSLLVLIIPTLRCDHDCGYCQVSRVSVEQSGYDANFIDIEKAISFLKSLNVQSLKIEFQGGEPLLNQDYIKRFYDKANIELDGNVDFVICSALGVLDADFLDWSEDKNISYSTSLDGPEILHVANRPSKNFNSYFQTINGIKLIQKRLGIDRVNALSTITKRSLCYPKEIIDEYINIGFESIFIRPLSPLGFAYKNHSSEYSPEMFIEFYKECMEYILTINQRKLFIEETALIYLKKILLQFSSGYIDLQSPSGYLTSALVINYDGNIFGSDETRMLWEMTKNNELVSGNIKESSSHVVNKGNVNLLSDTFASCTPGCDECVYLPYCGADPLFHLATQGDHVGNKAISDYCKLQKYLFDYFFELLSDKTKKEIILQWLK